MEFYKVNPSVNVARQEEVNVHFLRMVDCEKIVGMHNNILCSKIIGFVHISQLQEANFVLYCASVIKLKLSVALELNVL